MKLPIIIAFLYAALSLSGQTEDEIYSVVERRPMFPFAGCDSVASHLKEICAGKKMMEFIYENMQYPIEARKKGTEGTVFFQFVVEKDGCITNAQIVRDIGDGCGKEALRLVQAMPKWIPGMHRGKPVRFQYKSYIEFKLD